MIKVLVVEDDPIVAEININSINRIEGFSVIGWENNGYNAFNFLKNNKVDLFLLDIYMPKMDGLELLEKIRKEYSYVDVIFITAAKEKNLIECGLKLGAVDYLIKPFKFERIKFSLENFKKRYELFKQCEEFNQESIDNLLYSKVNEELPKGISNSTLINISQLIDKEDNVEISTISKALKLSTVTVRHYLDYLVDNKKLIKDTSYGKLGRPTYIYSKLPDFN